MSESVATFSCTTHSPPLAHSFGACTRHRTTTQPGARGPTDVVMTVCRLSCMHARARPTALTPADTRPPAQACTQPSPPRAPTVPHPHMCAPCTATPMHAGAPKTLGRTSPSPLSSRPPQPHLQQPSGPTPQQPPPSPPTSLPLPQDPHVQPSCRLPRRRISNVTEPHGMQSARRPCSPWSCMQRS